MLSKSDKQDVLSMRKQIEALQIQVLDLRQQLLNKNELEKEIVLLKARVKTDSVLGSARRYDSERLTTVVS